MNQKRLFQFRMPDGSVESWTDTDYLKSLGMTDDFIEKRQRQEEAHRVSEIYHERKWRNEELILTDKLLFLDATYQGQRVEGSSLKAEILDYRAALRAYDLKHMERPERPEWFKG